MSSLNKPVLVLNKGWAPIHVVSVTDAIGDIMVGSKCALDHESYVAYDFEGWYELPVQDGHNFIQLTRGKRIRVPEVVVCSEYNKIPKFAVKLNRKNVYLRDNYTCQYTGERLSFDELNLDHVIPASRGGRSTWDNLVACSIKINTQKGNRTPDEAGLKLIKPPRKPKWTPLYSSINAKTTLPSWKTFLPKSGKESAANAR